ncbi:exodeoxyribonuclease V alpha subunit [Streptosporangium becharense]|uniref:ATP-dependent RecD2 DNA helicase n=1 Tax=Streptosporangium becharense TaxID=1816182 RepID=A0A7W9MH15_9ACTN|nr:ATP-dependent RecD-like DNA helicase [Streptosporangium becharense]MBB2912478.1 exodeoxyribonuclease V alpha subunit [Streptosporangium becharense]MBB5820692.1 exodeoxyribonuclease V alpha subunit [Streptosporangium becharense]
MTVLAQPGPAEVEASVEQLVYVREDEYTVARMSAEGLPGFVASGRALAGAQPGETLRLVGEWDDHPRHGSRLMVGKCERVVPSTVRAIALYLGSGLIRGIGPRLAHAIVSHFGERTLTVIDTEPERLTEVINIGAVRQAQIVEAWAEQKAVAELMVTLQGFGISPLLASKIYHVFGNDSPGVLASDPYRLIGQVRGIAFHTADRIALRSGVPEHSPQRIKAAVLDRLEVASARDGHCFLPLPALVAAAAALVEQEDDLVRQAVDALTAERRVVVEAAPADPGRTVVYAKEQHSREAALTANLDRLWRARSTLPLRAFAEDESLHEDQRIAVNLALTSTVSVLTGGPGCGKSHTVKVIAQTVRAMGGTVTLTAPTGKAAKRLSELTGLPAMTVHRMLAQQPDQEEGTLFQRSPAAADLVVVDEASMLDLQLATRLTAAIPAGGHLLLVGDGDQLPSIGPGNVLADLLRVREIPRVRLTHVFRQAQDSGIVRAAHRIRAGELPALPGRGGFWFEELDDPDQVAERVVHLATEAIPRKQNIGADQVQVLCPMRRGATGTAELGRRLQERLNPAREGVAEHWSGPAVFRVGDRVMPIRNNYDKGVFNGETATVTAVSPPDRLVEIRTDDGEVAQYTFDELDELTHAYAISVHRSQGSEYPFVVAPIVAEAGGVMLRRGLLYTLVTRARSWVVLVGRREALELAVHRVGHRRNTGLAHRLAVSLGG